jgi:hypothetical protein
MNPHALSWKMLRGIGGEVDSRIRLKFSPDQPGHNMQRYESIESEVTLLVPFTFNGHNLFAVETAVEMSTTMRTVSKRSELDVIIRDLRRMAYGRALVMCAESIPKLMAEVRGTVSNRKKLKKARATLNRFGAWNSMLLFKAAQRTEEE